MPENTVPKIREPVKGTPIAFVITAMKPGFKKALMPIEADFAAHLLGTSANDGNHFVRQTGVRKQNGQKAVIFIIWSQGVISWSR